MCRIPLNYSGRCFIFAGGNFKEKSSHLAGLGSMTWCTKKDLNWWISWQWDLIMRMWAVVKWCMFQMGKIRARMFWDEEGGCCWYYQHCYLIHLDTNRVCVIWDTDYEEVDCTTHAFTVSVLNFNSNVTNYNIFYYLKKRFGVWTPRKLNIPDTFNIWDIEKQ
jgi:hypothetical protein